MFSIWYLSQLSPLPAGSYSLTVTFVRHREQPTDPVLNIASGDAWPVVVMGKEFLEYRLLSRLHLFIANEMIKTMHSVLNKRTPVLNERTLASTRLIEAAFGTKANLLTITHVVTRLLSSNVRVECYTHSKSSGSSATEQIARTSESPEGIPVILLFEPFFDESASKM